MLYLFLDNRGIHSVLEPVTPVLICLVVKDAFTSSEKVHRITSTELIKHPLQGNANQTKIPLVTNISDTRTT